MGLDDQLVVPVFVIEVPRSAVVSSGFNSYSFGPGYHSGSFQPPEECASDPLPLTQRPNGKQHKMRILVPVLHDPEGIKLRVLAENNYIGVCGVNGSGNALATPSPRQAILNQLTRQCRDVFGIEPGRKAQVQGGGQAMPNVSS